MNNKYFSLLYYGMANYFETYRKGKKHTAKCRLRNPRKQTVK